MTEQEQQELAESHWANLARIEAFAEAKLAAARQAHAEAPVVAGSLSGRQHGTNAVEAGRELARTVADLVQAWQGEVLGWTPDQISAFWTEPQPRAWLALDAVGEEILRRLRSAAQSFANAQSLQVQAAQAHAAAAQREQARQARAAGVNPDHIAGAVKAQNSARVIPPGSPEADPQPSPKGNANNNAAGRLSARLRAGRLAAQRARAAKGKVSE